LFLKNKLILFICFFLITLSGCTKNKEISLIYNGEIPFELVQLKNGTSIYNGAISEENMPNGEGVLVVENEEMRISFDGTFENGAFVKGLASLSIDDNDFELILEQDGMFNSNGLSSYGNITVNAKHLKDNKSYQLFYNGEFENGKLNGPGYKQLIEDRSIVLDQEGFFENGKLK